MRCLNKRAWSRLLLGPVLISTSLSALAADPAWTGVWRGTIGKAPVSLCLDSSGNGRYYYRANLVDIALTPKAANLWDETPMYGETPSGSLSMQIQAKRLVGYWSDPSGSKKQPLNLERVQNTHDTGCGSPAFIQTRLDQHKIVKSAIQLIDGKSYRYLSTGGASAIDDGVGGIELQGSLSPSLVKINSLLRKDFEEERIAYFECIANGRSYSSDKSIKRWSNHWLIIAESADYDCGAHPDHYVGASIYDTTQGVEISAAIWFKPESWDQQYQSQLKANSAFAKFVESFLERKKDPDCQDVFENASYSILPTEKGLIFYPQLAHVVQACADEIFIPYPKLKPFLNADGLKAINELMQEHP